jgi:hypothetical protein
MLPLRRPPPPPPPPEVVLGKLFPPPPPPATIKYSANELVPKLVTVNVEVPTLEN